MQQPHIKNHGARRGHRELYSPVPPLSPVVDYPRLSGRLMERRTAVSRTRADAGKGFIKDGNKNRLREQDSHKIVDTFNNRIETPRYSRIIPITEIADPKNAHEILRIACSNK